MYTAEEIKIIWSTVNQEDDWWKVYDVLMYCIDHFKSLFTQEIIDAIEEAGELAVQRIYRNGIASSN